MSPSTASHATILGKDAAAPGKSHFTGSGWSKSAMIAKTRPAARIAAAICLWLLVGSPGAALAQDAIGQVVAKQGVVSVVRDGRPTDIQLGASVVADDRIVTGKDGRVEISFTDGTLLAIGSGSDVRISDFDQDGSAGDRKGLLSIILGILRLTVDAAAWPQGFQVESRTVVASVRSTDWIVEASPERTSVFVVEGRVEVRARSGAGTVVLEPEFGTDVSGAQAPSAPKRWGSGRVAEAMARTQVRR
jgi:hypothetical protein